MPVHDYRPLDEGNDPGSVRLETNLPSGRNVDIPIIQGASGPELRLNPRVLDFERVAANGTRTLTATANNVGTEVLYFNSMNLSGSTDFSVMIDGQDPLATPAVLADPARASQLVVDSGCILRLLPDRLRVRIEYHLKAQVRLIGYLEDRRYRRQ